MAFVSFIRDSFWGRIIYHFSHHKYFCHKEEQPGYIVPDKYLEEFKTAVKETVDDANGTDSEHTSTTETSGRVLVTWDGEDDPENPRNWPLFWKGIFILEISYLTIAIYMASAIYTPGIEDLMTDLGVSRVKATLPLTMFVVGYGVGPMVLSPMSENAIFGRTNIYIVTLFFFFITQIPIALVNNLPALVVLRFISGVFSSPALATGGASVGDVAGLTYLPITIALWSVSGVCGPSLGPLVGSILVVKRDWHWTFWFVAMTSGIACLVLSWFLPESYEKTLLYRKAKRLRKLTGNHNIISQGEIDNEGLTVRQVVVDTLWRPIEMILFEPIILAIDLYIALVYSILYLWFEAFPIAFIRVHHFALIPFGVTYLSVMIGVFLGAVLYVWYIYQKLILPSLNQEPIQPEVFIPIMIVGAILMPIGVFIFGWTVSPDIHWFPPLIGATLFSVSSFIIFQTGFNYLGASFYHYLASMFAGNALFRSCIGGTFPLFGNALYDNLGSEKFPVGWGTSILGFVTTAMIGIPVVFYLNGPKLRARSKYSSL